MIISASRRTDIPAYYTEWFMNRIKEGFCTVPNPFNSDQVSFIDLTPENVDLIVFWTRNPATLLKCLDTLDEKGYKYYFQYTINNYPRIYEKYNPSLELSTNTFIEISKRLGTGKVIWRYDPILFTDDLDKDFHIKNFTHIFSLIGKYTKRIVVSIVDDYNKTDRRLIGLNKNYTNDQLLKPYLNDVLFSFVELTKKYGIEIQSCAEEKDFELLGIKHGKCIDDQLILNEFGIDLTYKKDKGQRLACGCTQSKDIGMNNTCVMGCEYCYATVSHKYAIKNKSKHNPKFSSIIEHELPDKVLNLIADFKSGIKSHVQQLDFEF